MNKKLTIFSLLVFAIAGSLLAQTRPEHVAIGDIYCSNGDIVTPDTYGSRTDGIGVVFYVDETMQRGWIMYYKQGEACSWSLIESFQYPETSVVNSNRIAWDWYTDPETNTAVTNGIVKDTMGWHNTYADDVVSSNQYPAFSYAREPYEGCEHNWYLPACGQLNFMFAYLPVLNTSLREIGGDLIFQNNEEGYWSSNEYTPNSGQKYNQAWFLCGKRDNNKCFPGGFYPSLKSRNLPVRAVRNFDLN